MVMEQSVFIFGDRNDVKFISHTAGTPRYNVMELDIVGREHHTADAPVPLSVQDFVLGFAAYFLCFSKFTFCHTF